MANATVCGREQKLGGGGRLWGEEAPRRDLEVTGEGSEGGVSEGGSEGAGVVGKWQTAGVERCQSTEGKGKKRSRTTGEGKEEGAELRGEGRKGR